MTDQGYPLRWIALVCMHICNMSMHRKFPMSIGKYMYWFAGEFFKCSRKDDGRQMTHVLTVESFEHEGLPMHELNRKINLIWFHDLPTFSKAWGTGLANWVEMNRQNDIKNMFTFEHSGWSFCPKSSITSPPNKKNSTVMNEFILAPRRIGKLQNKSWPSTSPCIRMERSIR